MARSSHLTRREGGRYYLQIRLKAFSGASSSRLVRYSLGTSDYRTARRALADDLTRLVPLQNATNLAERREAVMAQLRMFRLDAPSEIMDKLERRRAYEHVVRRLIDEMPALDRDPTFNELWMNFCERNLSAERSQKRTDDVSEAYEAGRASAWQAARDRRFAALTPHPPTPETSPFATEPDIHASSAETAWSLAPALSTTSEQTPSPTPTAPVELPVASSGGGHLMGDYFEKFLDDERKRHGDDRARSETGPIVAFMLDLLGNKRPAAYSHEEFRTLNLEIPNIPTRKNIPNAIGRSLHARYLHALNNPLAPLEKATKTTIRNNYHSGLNRFFGWLHANGLMTIKPALNMVTQQNRASLPRDSFDDDEVLAILRLPLFTGCHSHERIWTEGKYLIQGSVYWTYLILLLTGMRPGEVGPLALDDIGEADGLAYLDLRPFDARKGRVTLAEMRDLKTGASARIVPLHPLLIELGLLDHRDHMRKLGKTRLLPDLEPYQKPDGRMRWSQAITKSWQYLKNQKKIVTRQDVTLYSTRHTMADMIDQLRLPQRTRDRVLGHSHAANAAGNYGRKGLLSTSELREITGIETPLIEAMRGILMLAKERADRGELVLIRPERPPARRKKAQDVS